MSYDTYRYLWPPRPALAVAPETLPFWRKKGFVAQVKKNGTCTVIFAKGDKVIFKTRHNDDHKLWTPLPEHIAAFAGEPEWSVWVGELLHSKTPHIKNHLYLFDVLVYRGEELNGRTLAERLAILERHWQFPSAPWQHRGTCLSVAQTITGNFGAIFKSMTRPEDEGLVLKDPTAYLEPCLTPAANSGWQVKVRRPTKNYSF